MHRFAALRARYPAITSLDVKTRRSGAGFEAQADVRLAEQQIIVNAAGPDAATAVARLSERVERELSIAPPGRAFVRA